MPSAVYTRNFGPHSPSQRPDFPALRRLNFLAPAREYYYLHSWPLACSNHIFWKLSRSSIFPCQRLFSFLDVFLHSRYWCDNSLDFYTVYLNTLEDYNNLKNSKMFLQGIRSFSFFFIIFFLSEKKKICFLIVSFCLTVPRTGTVLMHTYSPINSPECVLSCDTIHVLLVCLEIKH